MKIRASSPDYHMGTMKRPLRGKGGNLGMNPAFHMGAMKSATARWGIFPCGKINPRELLHFLFQKSIPRTFGTYFLTAKPLPAGLMTVSS